jgi:hypothetical protein
VEAAEVLHEEIEAAQTRGVRQKDRN